MPNTFVANISSPVVYAEESVRQTLFDEYKRVVLESLISSFGLDFLMGDKHGGDVDTIHNVRQIGSDDRMSYKNKKNEENYNGRGKYSYADYHGDSRFANKKHQAREKYQATGHGERDTYTDVKLEHTTASAVPKDHRAELDHVVETKAIHDDRGRVLAGVNGVDLANSDDNLAWTNKSLNASMGSWARHKNDQWRKEHGCDAPIEEVDMKAYLKEHPEIDPETQKRMLNQYKKSRASYEHEINKAYYTSRAFFTDTASAAGKLGAKMGMKAVAGLIFAEVWFAVEEEFNALVTFGKEIFIAIGRGVKKGFDRACQSYRKLIDKFLGSAVAGILSSLFTTITNIFFTTAKSFIRIIRNTWASLVEAVKVLFFNPDCLPMGDRIRSTAKIIATGASVVSGVMVTEFLSKTCVGTIPFVGDIISTFCGTFTTGIMTCSLLYFLDHNSAINKVVDILNKIPSIDNYVAYVKLQSRLLDEYAAKLLDIDIDRFENETKTFAHVLELLDMSEDNRSLNNQLVLVYEKLNLDLPWNGCSSFDAFMTDNSKELIFK